MEPVILHTRVKDGQPVIKPERIMDQLARFKGDVTITIAREKRKRTTNQNAYYWAVVVEMGAGFCGYTPEQMHDAFRGRFLQIHNPDPIPDSVKSTTELSTTEFSNYVEQCRQLLAEMGVITPDPDIDYAETKMKGMYGGREDFQAVDDDRRPSLGNAGANSDHDHSSDGGNGD